MKKLTRSFYLLSAGTFLEYFDLFLYVYLAVWLNECFFPQTDWHKQQLLTALTYCTTYVFRPLGALLLGYIADTKGRKQAIMLTTFMMAFSCLTMSILPTYAQIGLAASWVVMLCRIIQGCASLGELIGAEVYLTETMQPPSLYFAAAGLTFFSGLGAFGALSMAQWILAYGLSWRLAFLAGAGVALVGFLFRRKLSETPVFVAASQDAIQDDKKKPRAWQPREKSFLGHAKVSAQTAMAYFFLQCSSPLCFYFVYMHCSHILKAHFGYTVAQIITHNVLVAVVDTLLPLVMAYLSLTIYPLKILRYRLLCYAVFVWTLPWLLNNSHTPQQLLGVQYGVLLLGPTLLPAGPIFYQHFTALKRFTYPSLLYTLSHALIKVVTAFGLVYLVQYWGNWGLLVLFVPVMIGYTWGLMHFEKLTSMRRHASSGYGT